MHMTLWQIGMCVPVLVPCRRSSRSCGSSSGSSCRSRSCTSLCCVFLWSFHWNQTLDNVRPMLLTLTIILKLCAVAFAWCALARSIKIEAVIVFLPLIVILGRVNGKVLVAFACSPGARALGIATRQRIVDVIADHVAHIVRIGGVMRVAVIVFNFGAAVTRPQQLTIDIEQVLGWATAARHDEMGMGGHTVTPIPMIRLHYHLGVKFVFRIVGDIIVKANTVEQFLVRQVNAQSGEIIAELDALRLMRPHHHAHQ